MLADTHLVFLVDIQINNICSFMPQVRIYFMLNLDDIIMYYVYSLSYFLSNMYLVCPLPLSYH